jgi:ATP-dependent protease La (LON) substrate-binding domain
LHLPGGTKAARSGDAKFALKTWEEECLDEDRFDDPQQRSAVVGTLMRITDYRRIKDGRLILLVHALERFVVDQVVQSFPHAVAHVQILPDTTKTNNDNNNTTRRRHCRRRAAAVVESFRYHNYECDPKPLSLPRDVQYMAPQDILGVEIARYLPFATVAPDDSMLPATPSASSSSDNDEKDDTVRANNNSIMMAGGQQQQQQQQQPALEELLQRDLILRNPPPLTGIKSQSHQSTDALETLIWLALQDYCRATRSVLPEQVACLRPPDMDQSCLVFSKSKHRGTSYYLSEKYPKTRRQWRLSYHAAALLENNKVVEHGFELRQMLLNTPSTQARLAAVLERFQAISNQGVVGQFD